MDANSLLTNYSFILTIVFGVTGGILTLVGLIAIFISISTQHNVQKAREILWELQGFHVDYHSLENEKKTWLRLEHLFYQYEKLLKVNKPVSLVIKVAKGSIFFVGMTWLTILIYLIKPLSYNQKAYLIVIVSIGILILLIFIVILNRLGRVTYVADLPKIEVLKNIRYEDEVMRMPYIASLTSSLYLEIDKDNEEWIDLILAHDNSAIPWQGHNIKTSFNIFYKNNGNDESLDYGIDYPEGTSEQTFICIPSIIKLYREYLEKADANHSDNSPEFNITIEIEVMYKFREKIKVNWNQLSKWFAIKSWISFYKEDKLREAYYYYPERYIFKYDINLMLSEFATNKSERLQPKEVLIKDFDNKKIVMGMNTEYEVLTITNNTLEPIDISSWYIKKGDNMFTIPSNTTLDVLRSIHIFNGDDFKGSSKVNFTCDKIYLGKNTTPEPIILYNNRNEVVETIQKNDYYLTKEN